MLLSLKFIFNYFIMLELNKIHLWDCLELMQQIPDKSIDLVLTDPPYYNIMNKDRAWEKHDRDSQWNNIKQWIDRLELVTIECSRVLKDSGSLFIFWDDKNTAYMQVMIDKYLNLENSIVRYKPNNMTAKWRDCFRCYCPMTERLLFYSKEYRNNNLENESYASSIKAFAPIIDYMIEQKRLVKEYFWFKTDIEFNNYINDVTDTKNVVSRHYFTYSQRCFPTEEIRAKLQGINSKVFKKEYEVFKKEYEDTRRYFKQASNYTDVRNFNIIWWNELEDHPTQKPISLIKQMIDTTTRQGMIILDPFLGSWTTAVACKQMWRNFIGIEKEKKYVDIANKRLQYTQVALF